MTTSSAPVAPISLRAILAIGDGTIEANPFARMFFSPFLWPNGRRSADAKRDCTAPFTVEREPSGWVLRTARHRHALVPDEPVLVDALRVTMRPIEAPLVRWRVAATISGAHVDVELIDAPWPLNRRAPRRLGVLAGALVEIVTEELHRELRAFDVVRARISFGKQRWVALHTRCEVPLRWLVEASVTSPVDASQVDEIVVDVDGNIRRVPLAPDELARATWGYPSLTRGFIHAGVVAGFFPDRVREWRELEEQVATLPR